MTDLEKASLNAVSAVFPNAMQVGCLFHLGKSLCRKVQDEGNDEVRLITKMLLALAFVPAG